MGGEPFALFAVVVSFHTVVSCAGVGIEVDADKDSVAIAISDDSTAIVGDEDIATASHGDRHTLILEEPLDAFCNTEREVFLVDLATVGALVFSSVARIDDNT